MIMQLSGNTCRMPSRFSKSPKTVTTPAFWLLRPTTSDLHSRHRVFQTVADASSVPVVLYDIPYRTGVRIERETIRRIVRHPQIAAVKDCVGDIETTIALINDGYAEVLIGEDIQIFTNLSLGGAGAISASAHIRPDLCVQMMQQMELNDVSTARATFSRLLPWIQTAFIEPNPAVVKAALSMQGLIVNEVREPTQPCTLDVTERLQTVLNSLMV